MFRMVESGIPTGRAVGALVMAMATALILSAASFTAVAAAHASPSRADGPTPASSAPQVTLSDYKGPEASLPNRYPTPRIGAVKSFTIGFMNPVGSNQNLQAVQDAARIETEKLGGRFIAKNDQVSMTKQLNDFKQLMVQGADAILLYPLDPKALGPVLAEAKKKGVIVIGYDVTNTASDPLPDGYTSEVMQGRDWQAWAMTKAMASADPGGKIGLMGLAVPVPGIIYLMHRVDYWAGTMGLNVVGRQDNREDGSAGGMAAATALLGSHPAMTGIIAYNDPTAAGAAAAVKVAGRHITIVGMNGDDYGVGGVKVGRITATFQNDAVGQGVQGVIGAYDALSGMKIPKAIVRQPTAVITKATVNKVPSWDQQLAKLKK